jgi:CRISPR system Cascade subunit CasD
MASPDPTPRTFLLFRLQGPMASWGDIAVGERRTSWARPSRSAVLGLVAAALGIPRADRAGHDALEAGLGFAVRVDDPGRPLRDYHTAQAPSRRQGQMWATRADELALGNDLTTILSQRSYLVDALYTIVLWRRPDADATVAALATIAERLRAPVYALYLGRKCCPLGAPLDPFRVDATDIVAALDARDADEVERARVREDARLAALDAKRTESARRRGKPPPSPLPRRPPPPPRRRPRPELWLDETDAAAFRLRTTERTTRRDRVRDRPRWLFADRVEVLIDVASTTGGSR